MRYELMLPHQIRRAIRGNWPVILPLGVLEYHGEHLGVGMDTLVVVRTIERLEKEMDLIMLPPFYYGAASYAVEAPEGNGSVQIEQPTLASFGRDLFLSLLRIGFRNVHAFIHHQSENFIAGMPTDLSFKFAARQATFDFLSKQRGEGWWGSNKMQDYYARHDAGANPFNWIQIHPLMDAEIIARYDFDHAGIGETSLMMSLCPEAVNMKKLSTKKWYLRSARRASKAHGDRAVLLVLDRMRSLLQPKAV